MRRSDFARHDRVMNGLIVDHDGLDVLYWRKLTDVEAATGSGSLNKTGIRVPVAISSSYSSSSLNSDKSNGRNFEKYSRRTRRSRVGSVEMTTEVIAEEISVPEVISLIRGSSSSSSSNEERSEIRGFSPPSPPSPRESPHVLPQSTFVEPPAALPGQNQASKVSGLTSSSSKARRLLRSSPARELPEESTAPPSRQAPQVPPPLQSQEQSAALAGPNQASKVTGLTNSRSRLLRSPRVREPPPQEEPQAPAPPPSRKWAASLTGQTQQSKVIGLTNSNAPHPLWPPAATDPPKASIASPPENTAASLSIQSQPEKVGPSKTPLPPQMPTAAPPPPPPPPKTLTSSKAPPPPPPLMPRRPANATDSASVLKPPPPPLPLRPAKRDAKAGGDPSVASKGGSSPAETAVADEQVKLKPLHWEKVNVDSEHSMVWNKIDRGSFRVDGDLMEALFGSAGTNQKPVDNAKSKTNRPKLDPSSTKIFILDIRKSQNIAIILRSLGVSHSEILQSLDDGHGLMAETLERLNQIVLSKEEHSKILRFDGNVSQLADAESFLFKLLKAFPSAFTRFHAMLFKLTFDSEISQMRESMKVIEAGCTELRNGGIFVKLLEAILKAGNRMNAGTARGDAAAFNLNSLKKLADVKSVDGKTTLLHFVVEEVIRSEGKRRVLNRARNPDQSKVERENTNPDQSKEEREKEFTVLGLSAVGALNVELSNVKKAATIDSKSLSASSLSSRLIGYKKEMTEFIAGAEKELESVQKTQMETLDLVKKTTEYYGLKDDSGVNPLQIFVVVKDFLAMVDKVCAEIARNLQRKKAMPRPTTAAATTTTESSTPVAAAVPPAKFIKLPAHFVSGNSTSDDSDTEF